MTYVVAIDGQGVRFSDGSLMSHEDYNKVEGDFSTYTREHLIEYILLLRKVVDQRDYEEST